MTYRNNGKCDLVFPSGAKIEVGGESDISPADLENATVKSWIEAGVLSKASPVKETTRETISIKKGEGAE